MKKITCFVAAVLAASSIGVNAQSHYKNYFIDQDFNEIEVLPAGWSVRTGNSDSMFGKNGSITLDLTGKWLKFGGDGSGSRGAELVLPSTSTKSEMYATADSVWNIEFDLTLLTTASAVGNLNAFALVVSGSGGQASNNADGWYIPGIFGLYMYKDGGFIHYMNQDRDGLPARVSTANDDYFEGSLIPGAVNGQAFLGGNSQSWRRANCPADNATHTPQGAVDSLNAPSATPVVAHLGGVYHITAQIDFKKGVQKVLSLTITELADPSNTATISTPYPFLAPTWAGSAASTAPENRIVTDINVISVMSTRGNQHANGNNANLNGSGLDNLQIYVWKESLGQRNVTVNYKDQNNAVVKTARVAENQEVGNPFTLKNADKQREITSSLYYGYNPEATHAANAAKGNGEELTVSVEGNNSLDVIFKKSPLTAGTYVWTGAAGWTWDEVNDNFSVGSGTASQSYQVNNPVEFSNATVANKEIIVDATIEMGTADITVSAADYLFKGNDAGTGKIIGQGSVIIDAATALQADNRMEGGAVINTAGTVKLLSPAAVSKMTVTNPTANLHFEAGATFSKAIEGAGGVLNMTSASPNEISSAITNFSTVNISFTNTGRETGNAWTNPVTTAFAAGTQVNIIDIIDQDTIAKKSPATYAVNAGSIANAKVDLGSNVRLMLNGTPAANSTTTIKVGALSGAATALLEGNSVAEAYDRKVVWEVGGLNTDAVFNGTIRPQTTREPARRSGTKKVFSAIEGDTIWYLPSLMTINKEGTGKWTLGGKIIWTDENAAAAHALNVKAGTLEILDSLVAPAVNTIKLTVDSAATLKTACNYIGAYTVLLSKKATLEGGAKFGGNFSGSDSAVVKLNVPTFTDYCKIEALGDISLDDVILDITVGTPTNNGQALLFKSGGNANYAFVKVLVNGTDITENTENTEVPDNGGVYWLDDDGNGSAFLHYKGNETGGTETNFAGKEVRSIEYFNALGQKVSDREIGYVIRKITYTDGAVQTQKVFVNNK